MFTGYLNGQDFGCFFINSIIVWHSVWYEIDFWQSKFSWSYHDQPVYFIPGIWNGSLLKVYTIPALFVRVTDAILFKD